MTNIEPKRNRYLKDSLPIRLGGIAANLARINSFSDNLNHNESVAYLINECRYFIEWAIPDAELNIQSELVDLQLRLSVWYNSWAKIWSDSLLRSEMASESEKWSEHLLELAGIK